MPIMPIHVIQDKISLDELLEEIAKLQKLFRYLQNGQIDFENIRARSIKAENIETETITTNELAANSVSTDKLQAGSVVTDKLAAGAVETDKLAAGAVTADKITVAQLSAIAADMGEITAGKITTSAEIDVGTDARIGNILYLNESDGSGLKGIIFSSVSGQTASINAESGDVSVQCAGFITFTIGSTQGAVFNQRVTAPVFNATSGISINGEAVPTTGYVNSQLATKANGSGLNAVIPPGSTLNVSNGVITSFV